MADNKQLSPGVKVVEKDLTQIVPRVSVSTGAVAGKFAWGPVMAPQLVSTEGQLASTFGKPDDTNYASWFTAANFLGYSNSMYVNRADSTYLLNAVANATGGISSITVTSAGSGYTTAPTVVIPAPNNSGGVGIQAEAVAVLTGGSLITTTSGSDDILSAGLITNGGTGFSVGDKVIFSTPQQTIETEAFGVTTSSYNTANGEVLTVSSGAVTSIKITNAGFGYTSPATITGFTQADGSARATGTFTHATIPVTTSGIKQIDMTVVGSGYVAINNGVALAVTVTGNAVLTPVINASGIKIMNKAHYDDTYAGGAGSVYGVVAAKYSGSLGNSLRFSMADSSTFDTTLDGVFYARNTVEKFESQAELKKLRRVLPVSTNTTSTDQTYPATSVFTVTSASTGSKIIKTSSTNQRLAASGLVNYQNLPVGSVNSANPTASGTYYKITLSKPNPALNAVAMTGKTLTLTKGTGAAVTYGTFDGYAKVWDSVASRYVVDKSSFYVKRTNADAVTGLISGTNSVIRCSALTGALTVTSADIVKGATYKIVTPAASSVSAQNWVYFGASANSAAANVPEFIATKDADANRAVGGKVTSTDLVGTVVKVEKVEVINLDAKAAVELNAATCDKEWAYGNEFNRAPGTSNYAANAGAVNDEVHMILIDTTGAITGVKNGVIKKWEGASKAYDAKASDGTSSYYKNLINANEWLWSLAHPATVAGTGSNWGSTTGASVTDFADIDDSIAANVVKGLTLTGGSDGGSLSAANVIDAYGIYSDSGTYDISLIPTGDADANVATWIIENIAAYRKDCVAFVSAPLLIGTGNDIASDMVAYRNEIDVGDALASYAVMDSGWKYQYDRYNDLFRWVPLNADTAGTCAYTDSVADTWFSPGGFSRGQIKNVTKLAFNPTQGQRDVLYQGGINPVVTFPGDGTVLFGDKTMQKKPSAFDRINVRRLFIILEKSIAQAAKYQLFEYNDDFTRAQFKNLVEPFLRDVQGRRGITDFKVICDTSNNTAEVIDSNEFIADIYIKPNRSINYITLNFIATKTGVSFGS